MDSENVINGFFSSFEDEMDLKTKFSKIFTFTHLVESESVVGVIQLNEKNPENKIDVNNILNCELLDYVQVGRNVRVKDEKTGRYSITTEFSLIPKLFNFQIINDKFVRIFNYVDRPIIIKALTIALGGTKNETRPINFDMKKLEEDYPVHLKSNVKRDGFWQGGTIHGINIAKDPLLAKEYRNMLKSSITYQTDYFEKLKLTVSVSKYGGVSFKTENEDGINDEHFIDYFINELTKYSTLGKVVKRRRISSRL